jgi:hypothetical protein
VRRLSCSTTLACVAVGSSVNGGPSLSVTHDGGETWIPATLPTAPAVLFVLDAACRSDGTCFAVIATSAKGASALLESTDGGATFEAPAQTTQLVTQPIGVGCASTTCVVVGADERGAGAAVELTSSGSSKELRLTYAPTPLLAISCATPSRCAAVSTASLVILSPSVPKSRQQQAGNLSR